MQVILSILRPSLEYGNEVWRCTSTQSKALDAVLLGACKNILSCSSKTCNEAVWGDLGVEPLALKRTKSKVVWYSKLLGKDKNSYCRQIFDKEWGKCKLRGRRRKQWKKCVMDIISDMRLTVSSLDSKEALTNIDKVYMDYVTSNLHASMCEKNKLRVYRELKQVFECKKYLYGVPDMDSKLLFRFRSGTHGLNEELGRHITRNVSKACVFCNCDCESVEHVLWECPAYSNNRSAFINSPSKILCSDFHLMSAFEKTRYVFDQSIWECNGHFDHWFSNIKDFCAVFGICARKNFIQTIFDEYSFKQLRRKTRGQWQKCYGEASMSIYYIYIYIYIYIYMYICVCVCAILLPYYSVPTHLLVCQITEEGLRRLVSPRTRVLATTCTVVRLTHTCTHTCTRKCKHTCTHTHTHKVITVTILSYLR